MQRLVVHDKALRYGYKVPRGYKLVERQPEYRRGIYYRIPTRWGVQTKRWLIRRLVLVPFARLLWLRENIEYNSQAFRHGYEIGEGDGYVAGQKDGVEKERSRWAKILDDELENFSKNRGGG